MNQRTDRVASVAVACLMLVFGVLLGRVAQLQIIGGEWGKADRVRVAATPGIRGDLLDRRGRLLSTTRFARRLFVDPEQLPDPPDEVIAGIADATGWPADAVGGRILERMAENDRRREALGLDAADPEPAPTGLSGAIAALREAIAGEREQTAPETPPGAKPLIRYAPVGEPVDEATGERVLAHHYPGVHAERVPIREYPGADAAAALVGKVGFGHVGLLGAELAEDSTLRANGSRTRYVPDARGRPLWIEPGDWRAVQRGHPVRLSIDLELQRIAAEEIARGVADADAAGGRIVVMDPYTGEVLAMADVIADRDDLADIPWTDKDDTETRWAWPDERRQPRFRTIRPDPGRDVHPALARNRCVEEVYEPGSTFKPFVWSSIIALGLADPDETIDTEGGRWRTAYGRLIEDVVQRDHMSVFDVIVNSSNIGMTKLSERMTPAQFHNAIVGFGFGHKTGIGLAGEASGSVTPLAQWTKYTHTSAAFGYEVSVTPIQMARAFSAFARSGDLAGTIPTVRLTAAERGLDVIERALPPGPAQLIRQPMAEVARKMEAVLKRATGETGWHYSIFGKSGTARIALADPPEGKRRPKGAPGYLAHQYNSSFVAAGPTAAPRLVVVVVIDDPGPERWRSRTHYGSHVAGPVVRRTLERGLTYLGVPADQGAE